MASISTDDLQRNGKGTANNTDIEKQETHETSELLAVAPKSLGAGVSPSATVEQSEPE